MRSIATCSAVALLLLNVSPAAAINDFDALLADVTFGTAAASREDSLSLGGAAQQATETLSRASNELVMPPMTELAVSEPMSTAPALRMQENVSSAVPPAPPAGYVDLGQAFAAQGCDPGGCDGRGGSCGARGCQSGHGGHHGQACQTCVPYHPVSLPSSSFYQYFRSNPCNVDVWNGYQNRCCFATKHIRGECDCFAKGQGCRGCEAAVYEPEACQTRVCELPAKKFLNFRRSHDCDVAAPACDGR